MSPTAQNVIRRSAGLCACGDWAHRYSGLRYALTYLLLTTVTCAARAELKWENTEQTIAVRSTDTVGTACFVFTNTGGRPVTITEVHPGCGCTVPVLEKNTYAPGERGELRADFHPGSREGLQRIPITVQTDDAAEPTALMLVVQIETVVTFDTRYVFWKGAEPRAPKVMRLTFAKGLEAQLVGVQCNSPQFTAAFRPIGDSGSEYEIAITPPAEEKNYTAITVRTRMGKTERDFTVVARTF